MIKHLHNLTQRINSLSNNTSKVALLSGVVSAAVSVAVVLLLVRQAPATPNFSELEAGAERKQAFFSYLLPLIEQRNQEILELRQELLELHEGRDQLSYFERRSVQALATRYEIEDFELDDPAAWKVLIRRVDIVPPSLALAQAANESAWGTSRFALEGNNFYGHWCFVEGCGLVPMARNAGAYHEVADFESAEDSVEKYIHNLNQHPAYSELRQLRADLRENDQPITGLKIVSTLDSYSERGDAYIKEVSSMIRFNELSRFDQITAGDD
jgi:Bax protein